MGSSCYVMGHANKSRLTGVSEDSRKGLFSQAVGLKNNGFRTRRPDDGVVRANIVICFEMLLDEAAP
mgnify:CR=1 FL=1